MKKTTQWVWLNGELVAAQQALISVQDRGFRLGDGLFETIRVKHKVPLHLPYHLERLNTGLESLFISLDTGFIPKACHDLIQKNAWTDGLLRLTVSRGIGSAGYLPLPDITPTIVIECVPLPTAPSTAISMMLSSYQKPAASALPTHAKTTQGLNSILARLEAQRSGHAEALLLNHTGHLCEASAANIFFMDKGALKTPAATSGCLLGITRRIIIENMAVEEGDYPLETIENADAVVLTNTGSGAVAVGSLAPLNKVFKSEALAHTLQALIEDISRKSIELYSHESFLA